jgi:AcrR family transcriptional regulator
MSVVRPYRGVSAEERRAGRREQLLEACREVIGRDGLGAATVGAVCAEAGLTKRYFYEGFSDRDALLVEVLDGLFVLVRARILAALEPLGRDPAPRAQATIEQLVTTMLEDPRIARLYVESPGHPQLLARREQAFRDYAELWNGDVLGIDTPSPRQRVAALHHVAGTTQTVVSWLRGGEVIDRAQLVDELAELGLPRAG